MFFGPRIIIVEGDTEYAAFRTIMDEAPEAFPVASRALVVRARGKAAIPTLIRMLTHFKVDFAVEGGVPSATQGRHRHPRAPSTPRS